MKITRKESAFLMLSILVILGLTLPAMIQDGMFMDGQQYACVAKNLAHGKGSFWFPYLSNTWYMSGSPYFMEQPPLVYYLQSIFFNLFGDSMYVERIYSLAVALLSAFLIIKIWKIFPFEDKSLHELSWVPVLCWISIPTTYWSFNNNMLENTMGLFTLIAVYAILHALIKNKQVLLFLIIGGLATFCATLSKGLPGFFPLACPIFYWLAFPEKITLKKALGISIILISVTVILYYCLLWYPPAYESLHFYISKRLLYRVANNPTVSNRFYIFGGIFEEIIVPILLCLLVNFILGFKIKKELLAKVNIKAIFFFTLIALSASLPLMLTPVQKKFYMTPAFAFFGIAIAIPLAIGTKTWYNQKFNTSQSLRKLKLFSGILLILLAGVCILFIGKSSRDKKMLNDVYLIGRLIPKESTITLATNMHEIWSLQFYLLRKYNISCTFPPNQKKYFLQEKNHPECDTLIYKKCNIKLEDYELYSK